MTREEALKYLKDFKDSYWDGMPEEALDIAIQALSQEPIKFGIDYNGYVTAIQPPVTQSRRKGHWIRKVDFGYCLHYICSECENEGENSNYCQYCGAEMS